MHKSSAFPGCQHRVCLLAGAILASAALALAPAAAQHNADAGQWVATWGTAPAGPPLPAALPASNSQTLRLIVHTTIAGGELRIRLSNEFGLTPLHISAAHIALRQGGAAIVAGSDRVLTFRGQPSITIAPGAPAVSDPVALRVPALSDLAVSLHLPGQVQASTVHGKAFQTGYLSPAGDFTGVTRPPSQRTILSWPFLTAVDVRSPGAAVVALGDSITDGATTADDTNHRWPDLLALRLQATRDATWPPLGVVNRGIAGNRLLRDWSTNPLAGAAGLARFDRDVLATAGAKYLIVLLGINDIGAPETVSAPAADAVNAAELIDGYRQLIVRAHAAGLAIYGATMTPFEGTLIPGYYTPAKEQVRQAVNHWIRTSGEFDAMIDFERAIRDPLHPTRMRPAFDSGDHLHPNDLGMQALADAIPLELFRSHHTARADVPSLQ